MNPQFRAPVVLLVQRLFAGYLPPVNGWFAMMLIRHNELL